eukprot:6578162-Prymnesium_polylepis.4
MQVGRRNVHVTSAGEDSKRKAARRTPVTIGEEVKVTQTPERERSSVERCPTTGRALYCGTEGVEQARKLVSRRADVGGRGIDHRTLWATPEDRLKAGTRHR